MPAINKITPCLWFDGVAEDAASLYVSLFPDSEIKHILRYTEVGQEIHGQAPGSVQTVEFRIAGMDFMALNGGPLFKLSEAVSFMISCADQAEVDYYWDALTEGGDPSAQQCGWLKDRFGLSWQVVPEALNEMMRSPDQAATDRVMAAFLPMKKLILADLEAAFRG